MEYIICLEYSCEIVNDSSGKVMMTEARLFLLLATFTLSVSANPLPLPACMLALKTHPSCDEFLDNELPLVERECGASANRSLAAVRPSSRRAVSEPGPQHKLPRGGQRQHAVFPLPLLPPLEVIDRVSPFAETCSVPAEDHNRTSPFSYGGHHFEVRAVRRHILHGVREGHKRPD